jgi:hypothetical protein
VQCLRCSTRFSWLNVGPSLDCARPRSVASRESHFNSLLEANEEVEVDHPSHERQPHAPGLVIARGARLVVGSYVDALNLAF